MLRLPDLAYIPARTVDEAVQVLKEHGPEARLVAGGTDLVPNLKRGQFPAKVLVGLQGVRELHGIRQTAEGGLSIGALTTLREVADHPAIKSGYTAAAEAASLVASPAIRSAATLGGNLLVDTRCQYYNQLEDWRESLGWCMKTTDGVPCRVAPGSERCLAVSMSDTAPALVALGARVRLAGAEGVREIPLAELYREDGKFYNTRGAGEVLTEILLPPADGVRSTYLKLRRRGSFDFPILGVAAAVAGEGGAVSRASLVLGAVASSPIQVPEVAQLAGTQPGDEAIAAIAKAAAKRARPVENQDLTLMYRKRMVQVFVTRALRQVILPA